MKKILGILVLGLLWCNVSIAEQCTQEDQNYVIEKNSDDYGTKVSAQDAYNFGAAITKAVEEKNLEKLLSFITHKKSFTNSNKILDIENYKGKKFDDIFTKKWRKLIIESTPNCQSHAYDGWMLGSGMIWYGYPSTLVEENKDEPSKNKYKNKPLTIMHINASFAETPTAWKIDDKYLTPECFVYKWYSGDQYEMFFETYFKKKADYDSPEFNDFRNNIGNYINKEVPLEDVIETGWYALPQISVTTYLDSCLSKEPKTKIKGEYEGKYFYYNVIEALPISLGLTLAPHLDKDFEEIKLVKYSYRLGSMGERHTFIIYGIVQLKNGKKVILPLRNFDNEEQAKKTILTLK